MSKIQWEYTEKDFHKIYYKEKQKWFASSQVETVKHLDQQVGNSRDGQ